MAGEDSDLIEALVAAWRRERPGTHPEPMRIIGRIIRLGRQFEDDVVRLLRPHGLSYSDFDVLATLRRSGEPYQLSPTQLQKNVLLSSGAMTACLRRLETLQLITREADPADRRRLSARLSGSGHGIVEALIDQRFEVARKSLEQLTTREADALEPLLRKLGS